MSDASKTLWNQFFMNLKYSELAGHEYAGIVPSIMGVIEDVIPVALTVAGAILVVTLGWRLFRNFTRG